jgi:hypothetical protein
MIIIIISVESPMSYRMGRTTTISMITIISIESAITHLVKRTMRRIERRAGRDKKSSPSLKSTKRTQSPKKKSTKAIFANQNILMKTGQQR